MVVILNGQQHEFENGTNALDMLSKAWNIRYERQGTKVWLGERHTGGTDSD